MLLTATLGGPRGQKQTGLASRAFSQGQHGIFVSSGTKQMALFLICQRVLFAWHNIRNVN